MTEVEKSFDAYVYTGTQESLEKAEKEVLFVKPLNTSDYQNKAFVIEDIDGRWLVFGLKIIDKPIKGTASAVPFGAGKSYIKVFGEESSRDSACLTV